MASYLWICMSCGLYMKCTPSMMPGQHSCNLSKESIKKNLNECLEILGTLCEAENATPNLVSQTSLPPPPPIPQLSRAPGAIASNNKERLEIEIVAVRYAAMQEELQLKLKDRARAVEESIHKAEKEQEAQKGAGIGKALSDKGIFVCENKKRKGTTATKHLTKRPKRQ